MTTERSSFGLALAGTLISQSVIFGLSVAYSAVVARQLHPTGRGEYALVTLCHTLLAFTVLFGLDHAGLYQLAAGREDPRTVVGHALLFSLMGSLVAGAVGIGLLAASGTILPGVAQSNLMLALAITPFELLLMTQQAVLLAQQQIAWFNRALIGRSLVMIAAGLSFALWSQLTVRTALFADLFGLAAAGVLMFVRACSHAGGINMRVRPAYVRACLRFGGAVHLGNLLQLLHLRVGIYLLGLTHGTAVTGLYSVGLGVSEKILTLSDRTSTLLVPRVALTRNPDESGAWSATVLRLTLLVMVALCLTLFVAAHIVVHFVFGRAFDAAVSPLRVLLICNVCLGGANIITGYLNGSNRPILATTAVAIAAAVNFAFSLILIPHHGALGSAVASLLSCATMLLANLFFMRRASGLRVRELILPNARDLRVIRKFATMAANLLRRAKCVKK